MDDVVWVDTTDGGLLRQMFGFYPTLHDAKLVCLELNRKDDLLTATVEYVDQPEGGESVLRVQIELEWRKVKLMNLTIGGTELMAIDFEKKGEDLETRFEWSTGVQGTIVAAEFEARLVQSDTLPLDLETVKVIVY